jgi:hypothetical protein
MAWEIPSFSPGGLKASADLSAKQYYGVKVSGANQVGVVAVDGEPGLGVLQNAPTSGEAAEVMMSGITKVLVGTTLPNAETIAGVAQQQAWGFDANGKAKPIQRSSTGADLGDFIMGFVIEGAVAGEYATVTVGLQTGIAGSL